MERFILQKKADNELMELAGQDDREAFEVLVLRYYREAIRAADRMVHDEMQAQDIVQDCFADLYVQRRRYHPSCSFLTYLYVAVLILRYRADGLRLLAISFSSLACFSVLLMTGIEKGRNFRWAAAVCAGWVTVNLTALYHFGGIYGELLFMMTLTFRKEYSDASN